MKGSLIIVSFFIIGTLCGVYHLIPYDFTDSKLSYYALCGLMFCVGISIGNDPNTLKSFRSLNPRLVFLPIMTIHWHISRLRRSRSFYEPARSFRLYGSRSRIWLLFTFQHFHYRIQRSRIGNYCVTFQYHA